LPKASTADIVSFEPFLEESVMRIVFQGLLALGLAAALVLPAQAQRGRPGGGGPFGGGSLLENQSVQKELRLSDEQIKKVTEITQSIRDKHREELQAVFKRGPQTDRERIQELFKTINEETNKALADVLTPEQAKRYKQITLQDRGTQAFNDEEVQKALKLTDEQKEKIKTINEDAAKERQQLFPRGGGGGGAGAGRRDPGAFEEMRKKMAAMNKETMEKVTAVLTDDQKKAWKDLIGEPFEVKRAFPRGGPRGGPGEKPRRGQEKDKQD
jgi:Spy/CpxP family protein refolding chaperone